MAIKMDDHEITTLELHGANGQTVTKQLTEDGVIPTPTGKKNITDTAETDVTNYASAQVVDANLVPENIAAGAVVLGVVGTHEGGGDITIESLNVSQNGVYTAPQGKAYSPVNVNVQGGGGITPVTLDVHGSDANEITINMPNTAGTSCLLEYSSDADASMAETEAIKCGYNVYSAFGGKALGSAEDTASSNRTPSMTRNPTTGTIKLSTTRPYPAAATYHFVYTEWTPE